MVICINTVKTYIVFLYTILKEIMCHDHLLDSNQGCHAPISVKYDLAGTFDTA